MDEIQLRIFSELLSDGSYDCKMYSGRFDFIKDPHNVTEEEFLKIPFSYKKDIRSHSLESRENHKSPTFGIFGSSGTTGCKTRYKFSMNDRAVFNKIASKILKRAGVHEGDIGVICAPVLDGVMAHTMMWQYTSVGAAYVNCPVPSPENFLEVLESAHPTVVSGLPSALDFSLAPKFKVPENSTIRLMLTGGHYFSNAKRQIVESKWNIGWYDFLGVSEIFGPIMGECNQKYGLHYDRNLFLVEIIDAETLLPIEEEGKIGMLVITPLWNKGSPLVRYWTDDFAYRITTPCSCGEPGDRIYICGRKNDYLYVNGKYIFPRDIEEIMFKYSSCPDVYVDVDNDENVIVYYRQLSDEGKNKFRQLFGISLKFSSKEEFNNMKQSKYSFFSLELKNLFGKG